HKPFGSGGEVGQRHGHTGEHASGRVDNSAFDRTIGGLRLRVCRTCKREAQQTGEKSAEHGRTTPLRHFNLGHFGVYTAGLFGGRETPDPFNAPESPRSTPRTSAQSCCRRIVDERSEAPPLLCAASTARR